MISVAHFIPVAGDRPMTRFKTLLAALALAHATFGCGASHGPAPAEQPAPTEAVTPKTAPQAMAVPVAHDPEPPHEADPDLRPPPVMIVNGVPPLDPACPQEAPGAGSACSVPPGSALSCSWGAGAAIEHCACISREGLPEGTPLAWNCDEGASGEGPAITTCPEAAPAAGSPCLVRGSNCGYALPTSVQCNCDPGEMQWKCDGDIAAHAAM
jgi:hypothetical protein